MNTLAKIVCLIAVLTVALTLTARSEVIRLKNGIELHGDLISFDAEVGVVVKRCDNGGIVTLRWEHIVDADAEQIKQAHGYGGMDVETILVQVRRLLLENGDSVIGAPRPSSRPGVVTLHRFGKDYDYLIGRIRETETFDVEAQEVFTGQELYDRKIGAAPPETALDHFKIGVYCESIAFYSRALEHYRIAAGLDPDFRPLATAHKIERMEIKHREAEATLLLETIRNRLYRKNFARALEMCDTFAREFPLSRQKAELDALRARIQNERHAHYQQLILTDYFTIIDRVAARIAGQEGLAVGDALAYARDEMPFDIKKNLARLYGTEVDEIEELWRNREGGGLRTATYGTATFILGERARHMPSEKASPERNPPKKELTLDDKLRKKLEALKKERDEHAKSRFKAARSHYDVGPSAQEWWRTAKAEWKKQLVCAFYADNSGDVVVHRVRLRRCPSCEGIGWFLYFQRGEDINTQSPCPVCKTLGIVRVVYFK